jgi:hypothetical protein
MLPVNETHLLLSHYQSEMASGMRQPGPSRRLDVQRNKLEYDKMQRQGLIGPLVVDDSQPARLDRIRLHLSNALFSLAASIRPSGHGHRDVAATW